jgi:uncharacterized protein
MFTKLTDTSQATIYSVLVLVMATGVALLIRFLELAPNMGMWILWSCTPTVAALIMLLVVTREGYSGEGWKVLGLHRLGLRVWWIAFGLTLLITVAASALVWATWHMPLILLTPVFPVGNKLISLPLFYGMVVAASFVYGYLRIYTGSVWPASLAHAVHNAAWGALGAFTATTYPVIVNKYLVGDYGILIFVGAAIGAIWLNRRLMKDDPDEPRPHIAGGEAPAT